MDKDSKDKAIETFAANCIRLGNECRDHAMEVDRLKAEVERLKEGNECLDQMHEKEMARSAFLCEEVNRTTAWGRGLESNLSWARAELLMVKAEVERLTSDIQMEKENEDRLVREWQRANNEVYGLQRQVAALIDNQTSLKAECERLTKAGDLMCRMAGNNQVINRHWKTAKKGVQS